MDNPVHVTRARTWDPIQGSKKEIKKKLKSERVKFWQGVSAVFKERKGI